MGVAQTAPITMSTEPAFTIVDMSGNTLHFYRLPTNGRLKPRAATTTMQTGSAAA